MENIVLTAREIYEIDGLNDSQYLDYLSGFPMEKRDLIEHIYSKNRALRMYQVRIREADRALGIGD
ncbi:MAG: hypothetical protein LBE35_02755 [Clostridiales bacterium]|jgi:hypothetical protein|nr:hypothetical protein [Clostridiales bacterium]